MNYIEKAQMAINAQKQIAEREAQKQAESKKDARYAKLTANVAKPKEDLHSKHDNDLFDKLMAVELEFGICDKEAMYSHIEDAIRHYQNYRYDNVVKQTFLPRFSDYRITDALTATVARYENKKLRNEIVTNVIHAHKNPELLKEAE